MMRYLLFPFLIFWLVACGSKTPSGILPAKKMQAVLWDMMQADEMADYYLNIDSAYRQTEKRHQLYEAVFKIHKTTKDGFEKSYAYYLAHPKLLKPILDSIQTTGERLQSQPPDSASMKRPVIDSSLRKGKMSSSKN